MSSLLTEDALTSTAKISSTSCPTAAPAPATATTTKSLFALAFHALNLCVFLVVLVALLLLSPAAIVILLPVACMAASVCLLCAVTARLLVPFVAPGQARELRGMREWAQDCAVEVDRAGAPGGFDDGASFSAEEEFGEQEQGQSFSSSDGEFSDSWDDEERRFFFVDTSSYCRTFYDLLAFWRSMERKATRGDRNAPYVR